jgi:ABC-2 type transport system permease protein
MLDSRLIYFIRKEILQLLRDPRLLVIAILVPITQLMILGYVATTDIKHVRTAVFNEDKSYYERAYLRSFENSGYFDLAYYVTDDKQVIRLLDGGRAKLALHVPVDFGRKIVRGETASVQVILDGTNSSAATIIQGYISQINFINSRKILEEQLARRGLRADSLELLDLQTRVWYNPELKSVNYMVPAIFALIIMIESIILTSASIIKEKERGTMEMLISTPLQPYELILGKLLPSVIVAYLDIAMAFLVAVLWFKVPVHGSIALFFILGGVFLLTGLGLGVFISTVSSSQRQAMMATLFVLIPSFIISGFIFPIANMPKLIQPLTYLIPVRYYLVIVRGIFLKGVGMRYLWEEVWPLLVFGSVLLILSVLRFRKRIE